MKPSVARIVHYVLPNGAHRPAIITCVPLISECPDQVNLQVFLDGGNDDVPANQGTTWVRGARYDETGMVGNSWHWPERIDNENPSRV